MGLLRIAGAVWLFFALTLGAVHSAEPPASKYDALIQQGNSQLQAHSAAEAAASGIAAVKMNAERWEGYALAGGALMNLKRYEEAADALSKAIERAPEATQPTLRELRRQCLQTPQPSSAQAPKTEAPVPTTQAEIVLWKTIEKSTNLADFQSYLDKYPNGAFAPLAQRHLAEGIEVAAAKKRDQEFRANLHSRFAYVRTDRPDSAKRYRLMLSDGAGEHILLASERAITSPALSPNGNSLAYVSFEKGASAIYVQDLRTGSRRLVSADRGINASPSWSPDGQKLALTLGGTNIDVWVLDVEKGVLTRITDDPGEDKEAVWTPDGRALYFTSERSGTPQIYRVELRAPKSPQRITLASDYAAHPGLSPDGSQLVMTSLRDGHYWLAIQDLVTGETRAVCTVERDTAARFGPKGDMLAYSEPSGSHTVIAVTPAGKCEKHILRVEDADLADPTVDYR
jgi:hypothetical protein